MSEQTTNTNKQKIYVPGTSVKEYIFPSGDKVLRFSINLEKFAPFVKMHKTESGYINFNINPRKEIGAYGESHSVSLDTWTPDKSKQTKETATPKTTQAKKETKVEVAAEPDDNF